MPEDDGERETRLAEERTDWAEDRTILAVERTFAGWMRTAFATIGIGIAFRALFGELEPPWLAKAIATGFITLGAIFAIGAERRASKAFLKLQTHAVQALPVPNIRWIGWMVAAACLALIAGLWIMDNGQVGKDASPRPSPSKHIASPALPHTSR